MRILSHFKMRIEFNIKPCPKPRMTRADRWKKRPIVLKYWDFCNELNRQAIKLEYIPGDKVSLIFFIPMAKSWSKKKREQMLGKPHKAKPDIDNLAKAFLDALLTEDSHVFSLTAEKYWSNEPSIVVLTDE
jgi:Holliday junction resolvase RusA-like endonuclease